jgi:hypothetical protein
MWSWPVLSYDLTLYGKDRVNVHKPQTALPVEAEIRTVQGTKQNTHISIKVKSRGSTGGDN